MDLQLVKAKDIEAIKNELKALRQNTDEWLINEDAIKFLKISKRTMYRYRISGKLPFAKNGRKIYFKKSDLQKHISRNYMAPIEYRTR